MNFFNKQKRLEQAGWSRMSQLLDKEMPVGQQRRNPLAAWLFMVSIVAASLVVGYALGRSAQKETIIAPTLKSAAANEAPSLQKERKYSAQVAPQPSGMGLTSDFSVLAFALPKILFVAAPTTTTAMPTTLRVEDGYIDMLQGRTASHVAQTNTHNLRPQTIDFPLKKALKEPAPRKHRWSVGLQASVATERMRSRQLDGMGLGSVVDLRLSKYWGLRSGLNYARYKPTLHSRPLVKVYDWDYAAATGDQSVSAGNEPWGSARNPDPYVIIPIEEIHRIELPLLAYWQPVPGVRTLGGFNLGYTAYGRTTSYNFADDRLIDINSLKMNRQVSRLATKELQNWQANMMAGLSYRPLRRLEIGAAYNRPIDFQQLSNSFRSPQSNRNLAKYNELNFGGKYRPQHTFSFQATLFF
jgi:hypothetical protein